MAAPQRSMQDLIVILLPHAILFMGVAVAAFILYDPTISMLLYAAVHEQ